MAAIDLRTPWQRLAGLFGSLLAMGGAKAIELPENRAELYEACVTVLLKALQARHGMAIVFISHDRTFVNMVATQVVEVGGARARNVPPQGRAARELWDASWARWFPAGPDAVAAVAERQVLAGGDGKRAEEQPHPGVVDRQCRAGPTAQAVIELFVSSLITFFVVIDPPGCAPIFAGLTKGASAAQGGRSASSRSPRATGSRIAASISRASHGRTTRACSPSART